MHRFSLTIPNGYNFKVKFSIRDRVFTINTINYYNNSIFAPLVTIR